MLNQPPPPAAAGSAPSWGRAGDPCATEPGRSPLPNPQPSPDERVPLRTLRLQLGCSRDEIRSLANALRIQPLWLTDHSPGSTVVNTVTIPEANRIIQSAFSSAPLNLNPNLNLNPSPTGEADRSREAPNNPQPSTSNPQPDHDSSSANAPHPTPTLVQAKLSLPGYFYIIQLEPEREPLRIKLGYTTDLLERLDTFLCVAPYARFLKIWRCKSAHEKTAIESIAVGSEHIRGEVYLARSLGHLLHRADSFFATLPTPDDPPHLIIRRPKPTRFQRRQAFTTSRTFQTLLATPSTADEIRTRHTSVAPACSKACVEAALSALGRNLPDCGQGLSVPPPSSRSGPTATCAQPEPTSRTSASFLARHASVAPACSKACGREAAPPGSLTSWCGKVAGGAEPEDAPPHNHAPDRPQRPRSGSRAQRDGSRASGGINLRIAVHPSPPKAPLFPREASAPRERPPPP